MRISHEAIYQALYVQGRGALRRELTACLRTGRALRVPRARSRERSKSCIAPEIMISQRPAEAANRAVPGHWEGDLILGPGSSAIGTLVERTTRFTILLHLPRMAGHGGGPRTKNGPALAGHGAEAVRDAITRTITTLPAATRGATGPRRPLGGFGSLASSIPLGLSAGRPFSPLSCAISARWAATVCSRAATLPSNRTTSAFSSVGESASRSPGGAIPSRNQTPARQGSENRAAATGSAAVLCAINTKSH